MPGITLIKLVSSMSSGDMFFVRRILICFCFFGLNALSAQYSVQSNLNFAPQYQSPIDLTISPDEISSPLDIGFDFTFFGNTYSQFSVSSNGFISFQNGGGSGTIPQMLPNPANPNNLIAIGWSGFLPDFLQISYESIGIAPYRSLHVNFYMESSSQPPGCPSGFYLDGQMILYESTNIIEIHTQNWNGGDCGIPSTQGIENEDGTAAYFVTGRNNGLWTTFSSLVRFIPDAYVDLEVVSIDPVMCEGLREIRMLVQNVGGATVDTFYADWTWDGVSQDAVNVYAALPPNSVMEVVLGQKTLEAGSNYVLQAWTYDPENHPDHFLPNDTIAGTVKTGLAGTFTIGGTTPDYTTIGGAIADLVAKGACDTVVFNIRTGTYTEELDFPFLTIAPGAVVIFQSETNTANDVTITRNYTSGSTNRMIEITNASHIRFNDLTLKVTGTVCSSVVYMTSYCADIQFTGCTIIGSTCNSTSTSGAVITLINGQQDDIVLDSNLIKKGSYGLYVAPGSSYANDLVLTHNSIDSFYRHGVFLNRTQGLNVTGNTIFSATATAIGIETNTTYGPTLLERNSIYLPQGTYGMRVYRYNYNIPSSSDIANVSNNMINLGGATSSSRVLSIEQCNKVNAWHNTINTTSTNPVSYSLYSVNNTLTDVRNSIITNFGAGPAAWMTTMTSDHNAFFNSTPPLISDGTNYSLLEDWVLASGEDQNSLQVDPAYVSSTDLHVEQGALNNAGDALTPPVQLDFDQENRNQTNPDIGADEFGFLNDDMSTSDILFSNQLIAGDNEVKAVVYNIGLNPVNTYTVQWKINNTVYAPVMVSTPIPPGGGDTIILGTIDFDPNVLYTIRVNTYLPNGNADSDTSNDTMIIGPVYAKLSGTYTVGGVDPDFASLSGAFAALMSGGILDSVAFAVRDGIYNDPQDLTSNATYACTKPINVYGESMNAGAVVFNNNNLVKPVIRLNGVHGIHFSHITFQITASAFHNVVIVENGATCNSFTDCVFNGRITTQTTTAYATVLCNTNQGINNDFIGCTFTNGSFGLYTNGPGSSSNTQVDILGNTFIDAYYYGLDILNSDKAIVSFNHYMLNSAQHASHYGLVAQECKNLVFSHNTVHDLFTGNGGISISECDGNLGDTTKIFDNFVYTNDDYGLGVGYSNTTLVLNNTVRNINGGAVVFYWSANFRIENNIFEALQNGPAIELLNMQGTDIVSENNCFYAPNADIGELANVRYKTLAAWQALGYDSTSFVGNPYFDGVTHSVHAAFLDARATPFYFVTDDLDQDPRHPTYPDIGADEFDPASADAGMLGIIHPLMPFPTGVNPVYIRFFNNGADTLTSLQVNWEVNGIPQESMLWTGILSKATVYDSLEIGSYDFSSFLPYEVKVWLSLPNGQPDLYTLNDTMAIANQYAGLAGVYTIGGADPDFITIADAVDALNAGGASAPVTFNLRSGSYSETILINDFPGSECGRPVVFQSESGDSSQVTISNLGINAYTIVLNGADGVHFKNMTLKSVNTSFRHVVLFSNGSNCNSFEGNTIKGFQSTSTASTSAVIRSTVGLDTANVFTDNRILEGSFSFHLTGNASANTSTDIDSNHLEPYYRGIYASAVQGMKITANTIIADGNTSGRGMEILDCPMIEEISYNKIQVPLGQYGIFMDNCDNVTADHGRIYNNFISVGGTSVARGIYVNGSSFQDVIHNNIYVYSTNATLANTSPLYLTSNPSLRIINNAVKNNGPGYAIYSNTNTSFIANNNAYFTNGTTFGFWNAGAAETTFANWKTASAQDAASINNDPTFMSTTDLHTFLALLNGIGQPGTGITQDIDGQTRSSTPDIGADEFDPLPSNDAGVYTYDGPVAPFANGTRNVVLTFKNFGGNTLTSVKIRWTVNGIEQTPYMWTGSLATAACATITAGSYIFQPLTSYIITAWTELPNGVMDATPENDLLTTDPFYASLSGNYTVGGFAPDFNDVSVLETILNQAGIVGNVSFRFRAGTYDESIHLTPFPKSSYAHSVTFESESGDSSDVIITQNVNNTDLIDLDNVHRIKFKKVTLVNTKGNVFQIRNGASIIGIENCELQGYQGLSSSRSLIYSPTTVEDSITILNNRLMEGYYSIYLYGSTFEKNHIVQGNTFTGSVYYCIYARGFENLTITGNSFETSETGNRDVYMYNGIGQLTFSGNRILSDNSQVAVFLSTVNNTSANASVFANNYIYKTGTTSSDVVFMEDLTKINIDFNSIYNDLANAGAAALNTDNLINYSIRNNIFYSTLGPAYQHITGMPVVSNYNTIFSKGPVQVINSNTNYTSLMAYATATGTNANSKSIDPLFIVPTDAEITQYQLNGTGIAVAGITTDIHGTTRTSPPDMGADEFTPLAHDVKMAQVISPADGCGLGANVPVSIVLLNQGNNNETGIQVQYIFNGSTISENIGALIVPAGDSLVYTFSHTIDASSFGSKDMAVSVEYPLDQKQSNDTLALNFTNHPPFENPVTNLIPLDGTVGLENQVSLSWSPVVGAVKYDLYYWPSSGAKPVLPNIAGITTINKLVTGLTYGLNYHWQVHAINICDEQLPSDTSSFTTRFLPDLVVESITKPATGFSEQTISVEWIIKNQGTGATVPGTWFDNIYLSNDPTYNSFDPLLASVPSLASLNPNQSYAHSASVVLPQGSNGLYYIIVKTDHFSNVKETVDNNNTTYSSTQIDITLSPPPDLVVTQITAPLLAFSGQTISMTYNVKNIGDGITTDAIWKDVVTLLPAPSNQTGTSATLLTRTHTGTLLPDSSYLVNTMVTLPANIFGDYQIRVYTDYYNDVFEFATEGNNTLLGSTLGIVLTPPPDLVVQNLSIPATLSLYQTNTITYQIKNQGGSAPTRGWTDRYYISPSPVYNTNFLTYLGYTYNNAGLLPGNTNAKSVSLKLTGNFSGTYYLYVYTDYNDLIDEYAFDDNNITRSAAITIIRPDLKVDSLVHAASVMSGSTLAVHTKLKNNGPGIYTGTISNQYYLSTDDILSIATDQLLSTKNLTNTNIPSGGTVDQNVSLIIPVNTAGSRFIICSTDGTQAIYEGLETNNTLASPITVFEAPHSDITTIGVDVPDTITAGVNFSFSYEVVNQGDVAMTQSAVDSLFLSYSPTWNRSTATSLGTRTTTFLDTSGHLTYTVAPATVITQNPNLYYIYIVNDAKDKVYEGSGESNNIFRSGVIVLQAYPQVDLALNQIENVPDTLVSGQTLTVAYDVTNLSSSPTYYGTWTEQYYFSVDSVFSPLTDMSLGVFPYTNGILGATMQTTVVADLLIPQGITGNYYLFLETDVQDQNDDLHRENNVNTARSAGDAKLVNVQLALYPDLQPIDFTAPVSVISGQYFDIHATVKNEGPGTAPGRTDKLYVSTNNVIDEGDVLLDNVTHGSLAADQTTSDVFSVFLPANYNGNYYLIYAVDQLNQVYEYNQEADNILLSSIIAVAPPPADLVVKNILVPDSILAGHTANLTWETENLGLNPATGKFREIIYLSPDTLWNISDEVVGIWDGPISLTPGAVSTKTVPITYNNVTNADYHTIIRTDARNNILESNENNNDAYSYDLTNVDIEEIFLEAVKEDTLYSQQIQYYKLNIGAEEAGLNVLVSLTGDSISGVNELYVKYGAVPTPADNDYSYSDPFNPSQKILIRDAEPGVYYIMSQGYKVGSTTPQPIEILARIMRMEIISMTPDRGGNTGFTTIEAIGSELDSISIVKLILDDTTGYFEFYADTFFVSEDGARVVARFNLENKPLGIYHFQCIKQDRWVATYRRGFEIIAGSGANIAVSWEINPKSYNPRFNTKLQIKIDIENIGDADAEDRFVRVGTPDFNNLVYYSLEEYYNGISHTQLVLPSEDAYGFAGILRPGGRRTYYVYGQIGGTQGFSINYDK